ncbi:MAG: hypothetical protein MK081_09715 [Flavobacteriales bacterium]|nr:hypothetical protein [Flavobacteriales bacterium]
MKKLNYLTLGVAVIALALVLASFSTSTTPATYEFTSFTVVESIIPNGVGRSRIITSLEQRDYKEFTSVRSAEDNSRNKSDRGEIRVKNFEETKLLNFFNIGGIRFQNIAANDAVINNKVNTMMNEGWELVSITAGVESVGDKTDNNGIYITRFYFKRIK